MGGLYQKTKKYSKSIAHFKRAIAIFESKNAYKKLAPLYMTAGVSSINAGKKKQSLVFLKKAVDTYENVFGKDSKEGFNTTLLLAKVYSAQKKYKQADEYFLKSYAIIKKNFGLDDSRIKEVSHRQGVFTVTEIKS